MLFFAKLIRALTRAFERIAPPPRATLYRPEKHYMRGTGPKSKRAEPGNGGHTTGAT